MKHLEIYENFKNIDDDTHTNKTFSEYLMELDDMIINGIDAISGDNNSETKLDNRQTALHSLNSIFRNYISSLQKEYGGDDTQLNFRKIK